MVHFILICTQNQKYMLSNIVGEDINILPKYVLSNYSIICEKYIQRINKKYENVMVNKYVILAYHIHMILRIDETMRVSSSAISDDNQSVKILVTKEINNSI